MRTSTTVVYCAIDNLIPATGKPLCGFPEFLEALGESSIPCVWITARTRAQLDTALRKFGRAEPFIAEGGSGVYLPEGYFNLKPSRTMRLARFTCIPVATPQPAAAEALERLASETNISAVPLRSLSPRELTQNTGLAPREAELLRLRDFDELFFFAGASDPDIQKFRQEAARGRFLVRPRGTFWSLSVGASLSTCVRELSKLYDRALHGHRFNVAVATADEARELFPLCQRSILLTDRSGAAETAGAESHTKSKSWSFPLFSPETWTSVLDTILARRV